MCNTECVPQNNVSVIKVFVGIPFDPGRNSLGGLARSLWNVAACWVDLVVFI
jgi:hypothetical protein